MKTFLCSSNIGRIRGFGSIFHVGVAYHHIFSTIQQQKCVVCFLKYSEMPLLLLFPDTINNNDDYAVEDCVYVLGFRYTCTLIMIVVHSCACTCNRDSDRVASISVRSSF